MGEIIKYKGFDHVCNTLDHGYIAIGIYISLPVLAYHILPWIFHKTNQTNEKQYQFCARRLGPLT